VAALRIHGDPVAARRRVQSRLPRIKEMGISVIREIELAWLTERP